MIGPDKKMDQVGNGWGMPANQLPVRCSHCTFPDIDFIPKPYLLSRGVASPAETSSAVLGNFLVRERVRRILEVVAPEVCTFYPTFELKSQKPAAWWLAVPNQMVKTPVGEVKDPRCSRCHEPQISYGTKGHVFEELDVFKSQAWNSQSSFEHTYAESERYCKEKGLPVLPWPAKKWNVSPPPHQERWTRVDLDRELYFSIRLELLFKRAKVRGDLVLRQLPPEMRLPTPADEAWVTAKLTMLARHGLVEAKPAESSSATQTWFKQYLKKQSLRSAMNVDIATMESQHKIKLPPDYVQFLEMIGPKAFDGVNGTEGFTARILPVSDMDFGHYRRGKIPDLDENDAQIDGVMFASTDHGDCFVFDVSAGGGDYPVYLYHHEENSLEPFATGFADCIKRFVKRQ
jgi:hypothetical protein